jgi:hypothetical protein
MDSGNKVLIADMLTKEVLMQLVDDSVFAIRIPNFYPKKACERLAAWYENHPNIELYSYTAYIDGVLTDIDLRVARIGISYNTTDGKEQDDPTFDAYYKAALPNMMATRKASLPYLAPIDQLCVHLDNAVGARIARFDGKTMFVGIGRITKSEAVKLQDQPHFDSVPAKYGIEKQFSANVFLTVPSEGGELEIWNHRPLTLEEIDNVDPNSDMRTIMGDSFLIKPEQGDLIIINPRRPHAVRTYSKGTRISTTCFIGYRSGKPLVLWS